MAPQVINGQGYDGQADIWSLGTILFEMITGYSPFTGTSKEDLKNNIEKGNFAIPKRLKLSLNCVHFLNACLQSNPKARITFEQLMQHSFLRMQDDRQNDGTIIEEKNIEVNELLNLSMTDVADMKNYHEISKGNQLLESFEQKLASPYKFLNQQNAIVLNTYEMERINQIYQRKYQKAQKTVENYFQRQNGMQIDENDQQEIVELKIDQERKQESDSASGCESEYGKDDSDDEKSWKEDQIQEEVIPQNNDQVFEAQNIEKIEEAQDKSNEKIDQEENDQQNQQHDNEIDRSISQEKEEKKRNSQSSYEQIDVKQLQDQHEKEVQDQNYKSSSKLVELNQELQPPQKNPQQSKLNQNFDYYQQDKQELNHQSSRNIIYTSCIKDLHRFEREGDFFQQATKYNVDKIEVLDTYF